MYDYLIVGNGVAGTTAAESIRGLNKEGSIAIVTDEDISFYYRTRLNEFISGEIDQNALVAKGSEWYDKQGIDLTLSTKLVKIEPDKKRAVAENGDEIGFGKLLLATGSHSFIPPITGSDLRGVFALRNIKDARGISEYAEGIKDIVLIGGGLLGLETGNALRKLGKNVMVVEFFPRLLPRQLDVEGARRLQSMMEKMGFSFRLGAKTQEIQGDEQGVRGVLLANGERLTAEMVIISAGVRPNLELAQAAGLQCDRGIKVNEHMETSADDIFAAGDVVEFNGMVYGIWPAAMEQGKIAGINMAGGDATYQGTTMANTLKVAGIDLASAGNIDADNEYESLVRSTEKIYKKIVIQDGRIIGCIMLGDTEGFNKIKMVMAEQKKVADIEELLNSLGFKVDQKGLPFCTTAPSAEHHRADSEDEPCDDGRGGNI